MNTNSTDSSPQVITTECEIYRVFFKGKLDDVPPAVYATVLSTLVVDCMTFPFTVVFNLLVMIAVKTKLRLRTKSNVMFACLAATDLLVGVVVQPLYVRVVTSILQEDTSTTSCLLRTIFRHGLRFLCGASILHLALMTGERFLAIFRPFTYTATATEGRILAASALAWTISLFFLGLPFAFDKAILITVNTLFLFLALTIIIIGQFLLYREARRHEKQVLAQQPVEARHNFLKEKKALKLTTYIVLAVLFCYLPMVFVPIAISKASPDVAYIIYF